MTAQSKKFNDRDIDRTKLATAIINAGTGANNQFTTIGALKLVFVYLVNTVNTIRKAVNKLGGNISWDYDSGIS